MKKNLLYLFTVLCTLSFFTACSDDDEKDPVDNGWKEISATYQAETLVLNEVTSKDGALQTVKVDATSADAASVALGNVIPGEAEVKLDAKLVKAADGSYSMTGENSNSDRVVSISGSVKEGKLAINTAVKITSPLVGTWNLKISEDAGVGMAADVILNVKTPDGSGDLISGMGGPILGQLIAKKVKSVAVTYGEDGKLGIDFETIAADDANAQLAKTILTVLDLRYYVKTTDGNSQLYLAVDKSLLGLLKGIIKDEQTLAALTELTKLLADGGGYYGIPLNSKIENDYVQFYVSKDFIQQLLPVITPLIPAEMMQLLSGILPLIQTATVFDFGLGFTK